MTFERCHLVLATLRNSEDIQRGWLSISNPHSAVTGSSHNHLIYYIHDFGEADKQWAGRVFSVICQVHTNVLPLVTTGPIFAQAARGPGSPFLWITAQTERVQDWPSRGREV